MTRRLLLFSFILSAFTAIAQAPAGSETDVRKGTGRIYGMVKDTTTQQPVEFANVALMDPSTNKPVDGTVCDLNGSFNMTNVPNGTFNVVVSFIGLETRTISNITVEDKSEINLGTINVGPVAKLLKEVTIEGQKTLIEEKVDRTIYNAENDQTAKGGDATDVLKRVPMLSVDMDGNVSLRGSQNIKVLINNKPSTITASSVADALKQIPADQIKTVEVITSPSAKYDAEGSAGIINIITKKNNMQGFSLNVDGASGYRGTNLGLNGSYRQGKMGFSLGGFGRAGYNINGKFENSQTTLITDPSSQVVTFIRNVQSASTRNNNLGGNYTLGWDYDIDKNNSLTASFRYGGRNNYSYQDLLTTQAFENNLATGTSTRNVHTTDVSGTMDFNLNYTHLFAKPQQEFSLLTMYSQNDRTNNFFSNTLNAERIDSVRNRNINNSTNQEFTLQADYQTPIGTTQLLEMGGKNITRRVSSTYDYLLAQGIDGAYVPNPNPQQTANVFNYNQNITAGYLSYTLSLPSGYSVKAGTRYEYTTINAHFQNPAAAEGSTDIPSYGVLVPSVNVSRKLKNGNVLKAAYNRRIQRPSIQFLNPNLQFSNQINASQGNTSLGPEYTNNYELSYNTFVGGSSLNFSTFVRNTNNSIQSIKKPYQDSVILTTYQNIGQEDAYGGSIFTGINVSNKFTLNGGGDIFYAVLKNNDPLPQYNAKNEGWVFNVRMFGNYKLDKGWGVQFFGFYRGRQVQLQGFQGGFGVYSVSVRKDLFNKKGSLGIGADNFFTPAIRIHNSTNSPLVQSRSVNELHNMNFKISFSYRIGKMTYDQPKRRKKSISNDDMKDGGDNNPASANPQQGGNGGGAPAQDAPRKGRGGAPKTFQKRDSTQQNFRPKTGTDSLKREFSKPDSLKSDTTKSDSIRVAPRKEDIK